MLKSPNPSKYSILEVPKNEIVRKTESGIFLPGVDVIRDMRREKAKKGLDVMTLDNRPDDNYLWGQLIDGDLGIDKGSYCLFNKFDGEEILHEDKRYFRIINANALAYFNEEPTP